MYVPLCMNIVLEYDVSANVIGSAWQAGLSSATVVNVNLFFVLCIIMNTVIFLRISLLYL